MENAPKPPRESLKTSEVSRVIEHLKNRDLTTDQRINNAIIHQSPVGISVRDRNGNLVICNSSWAEIWKKPAEEVMEALSKRKESLSMDNRDDYLGESQRKVREVYRNGGDLVLDAIYVPSIDRWVQQRFYGIKGPSSSIEYVVVLTENVTEQKKSEQIRRALHQSNQKYRDLVENLPVAAYTTNPSGYCVSCNETMVQMFEEDSRESLLAIPARERYLDPYDRERFITELMKTGRLQYFEVELVTRTGRPFWSAISATATMKDGELESIDGIIRDISSKKALEQEILKNQKLESIGILAGGIAHDFNNIMAAVLGNISLAKLYSSSDQRILEKLENAERATLRASELTRQLLTFSRGGKPVRKTVDVRNVIVESARFAATGSGTAVHFDMPEDLWSAEVDESQLGQVVNNLVINSVQASPKGGDISITCRNLMLDNSNRFSLPGGKYLRLVFRDRGNGIPEEIRDRIFDPYFTTKSSGSGLGLATAYSIIKNHYGSITVESSSSDGTVFFIHLPSSGKNTPAAQEIVKAPVAGRGRVLVMDDELTVCEVVAEMLTRHGYTAETALDGRQAVDIYGEALADGMPFDVVITDITVPGGMGGVETAERILRMNREAKIIVASGYANNAVMANYREHGFIDSLDKPFKMHVLLESVAHAMASG